MSQSTDTKQGWMPEAQRVPVPAFSVGNQGRKAAVIHIAEGTALSAVSWFKNPASGVSSHFIVSDAGQIFQCVSVFDTAYANGLSWNVTLKCWIDPEGNFLKAKPPAWTGLTPPVNPNWQTISIEREGHSKDQPSAAENAAVVRILQFVHSQFPALTWAFMQTLIGHCHISPIARANCPGPHVDYAALAAAANAGMPPKKYRVRGIPVYEQADRHGPQWGTLKQDDVIEINDMSNGHISTVNGVPAGIGFIRFDPDTLEAI